MQTYAETELLLLVALALSPNTVKDIAHAAGIKANTLYKWKTTDVHLSPQKADKLMGYFTENEPFVLIIAEIVKTALILLLLNSVFSSKEEVAE